MLVSHSKKFIFLKTKKTAGTSIEIYLQPYCVGPDDPYVLTEGIEERLSEYGIIGYRGLNPSGRTYYNHMPARELRSLLNPKIWDTYLKISCVRNPFDQMVSRFWFSLTPEKRNSLIGMPFDHIKTEFTNWVLTKIGSPNDSIISIDGQPVLDAVIRYESLLEDLEAVCNRLGIPFEPTRLGRYKSDFRTIPVHFPEYYNTETAEYVSNFFRFEIETFGYTIQQSEPRSLAPRSRCDRKNPIDANRRDFVVSEAPKLEVTRYLGGLLNTHLLARFDAQLVRRSALTDIIGETHKLQQLLHQPDAQNTNTGAEAAPAEHAMVLIYTWGKVGSQTIEALISESNRPCFRTHFLAPYGIRRELRRWRESEPLLDSVTESRRQQITTALLLREDTLKRAKETGVIAISGVRELFGHALSSIFQTLAANKPQWENDFLAHPVEALNSLRDAVLAYAAGDTFMDWFDIELNGVTGFDVRKLEFSRDKGWGIATCKGFRHFVFAYEKLGADLFGALAECLGTKLGQPTSHNVSAAKPTGPLFRLANEVLRFSRREVEHVYSSESSLIFYSDRDRSAHRAKWQGEMSKLADADLISRYQYHKSQHNRDSSSNSDAATSAEWERSMSWRQTVFEVIANYTEELRQSSVLHAGCQTGAWTCWLHKLGARDIDASDSGFADSFGVVSSAFSLSANYWEADKNEGFIPKPHRCYGLICSIGALDGLSDLLPALSAYRQCLSKNGVLILELRQTGEHGNGVEANNAAVLALTAKLEGLGLAVEACRVSSSGAIIAARRKPEQ